MCGIWGFITSEESRGAAGRLRFVESAAISGTLRGNDSTGAIIVPHKASGPADWCKVVGHGIDWLESAYTREKFTTAKVGGYRAVIGHNRSATQGKVVLDNAHPFQEGPITLVHNGTLDFMEDMKVQPEHVATKRKKVEVDSHLICHNLAVHTPEEVIPTLYGAFALVWHDARNDSIYMLRNYQRPLHIMRAKCENTVLFASEPDMLWWLAGRSNFTRDDIYSLDPGVMLEFKSGELKPKAERITLSWKYSKSTYSGHTSSSHVTASSGKSHAPVSVPAQAGGTSKRGRAMLTLLGLDPAKELEFSVESVIPARASHATVNGWAYFTNDHGKTEAIQAVIHGLDRKFAQSRSRDDWTVRPVAVWQIGVPEKQQPCLICRLVRVSPAYSESSLNSRKCVGPSGALIPTADWLLLTTGGCVSCHKALCVVDAPHLLWVENKTKAMCPECADRLTFPEEAAAALN